MRKPKKSPVDKVLKVIKKSKEGVTITEITNSLKISRCAIRTALAFLEGSKQVTYRYVGMAKVYVDSNGKF